MSDWSELPEELLHLISTHLEDCCFDVVHARSVCSSWRSSFPFPCSLLRTSYSLPMFDKFPLESKGFCTLNKIPLFLFRVLAPTAADYFLGEIGRADSEDHMHLLDDSEYYMQLFDESEDHFLQLRDESEEHMLKLLDKSEDHMLQLLDGSGDHMLQLLDGSEGHMLQLLDGSEEHMLQLHDEAEDHIQLLSPIQCSVKVNIQGSDPILINMLDCQILPLGHQYRIIDCNLGDYESMAFLPLNEDRGGGFVVLLNSSKFLLVLTSAEMKWKLLNNIPESFCSSLVTFKGRFYATFISGQIVVIDPYSLEVTLLSPSLQNTINYLVPSGNDELFLVEKGIPSFLGGLASSHLTCRLSRLDEDAGEWVEVSDLGDRILFIGELGNVSYSAKELPPGCGLSGNSILFTDLPGSVTYLYKYGVHTGRAGNNLSCWRSSKENCLMKLKTSFPVIALQVER